MSRLIYSNKIAYEFVSKFDNKKWITKLKVGANMETTGSRKICHSLHSAVQIQMHFSNTFKVELTA